jgi:hypothetical protein
MRRFLLASLLLGIGCAGTTGPRMRDARPERIDPPFLPIPKQEERARDRTAYPFTFDNVGPRTWAEIPSEQYGRLSQ